MSRTRLHLAVLCATVAAALAPVATVPARGAQPSSLTAADVLGLITYQVRTTFGGVQRTAPAVVGVPALADVDGGLSLPDLVVEALPTSLGSVAVSIDKLNPARALPVQVELVFDLPGAKQVDFGYDATSGHAPTHFQTTVDFDRAADATTTIDASVRTRGAGPTLGVIASLTGADATALGTRLDLAPVPQQLTAGIVSDVANATTTATLAADRSVDASLDITDERNARNQHVTAALRGLPTSARVEVVTDKAAGRHEVHYLASSPIPAVVVDASAHAGTDEQSLHAAATTVPKQIDLVVQTSGEQQAHYAADAALGALDVLSQATTDGAVSQEARLTVQGLPRHIDVLRPGPAALRFTADGPIGLVDGGLAHGSAVHGLAEDSDYVDLVSTADSDSAAVRLHGMQNLVAVGGSAIRATLTKAPGRLHLHSSVPERTIDAVVADLPATTRLTFDPDAGQLDYVGSDAIHRLVADVTSNTPFLGRATTAHVDVHDVPAAISASFGPSATPFVVPEHPIADPRQTCIPVDDDADTTHPCPGDDGGGVPGDGGDDPGDDGGPAPRIDTDESYVFDAHGATLGRFELALGDDTGMDNPLEGCDDDGTVADGLGKPNDALCEDGLVIEDLPSHFGIQARITGLKLAGARMQVHGPDDGRIVHTTEAHFELDSRVSQGRSTRIFLERPFEKTTVHLSALPSSATLHLRSSNDVAETKPSVSVEYDAASPIEQVHVVTKTAAMPHSIDATVHGVPASFDICQAFDGRCFAPDGGLRDHGSFLFNASSPVAIDLKMCTNPAEAGACNTEPVADGGHSDFLQVTNLKFQHIAFAMNKGSLTADDPFVFNVDTSGTPVSGQIAVRKNDKLLSMDVPEAGHIGEIRIPDEDDPPAQIFGRLIAPLSAHNAKLTVYDANAGGFIPHIVIVPTGDVSCSSFDRLTLNVLDVPIFDLLSPVSAVHLCD
jgi:hypothetical protein